MCYWPPTNQPRSGLFLGLFKVLFYRLIWLWSSLFGLCKTFRRPFVHVYMAHEKRREDRESLMIFPRICVHKFYGPQHSFMMAGHSLCALPLSGLLLFFRSFVFFIFCFFFLVTNLDFDGVNQVACDGSNGTSLLGNRF